MVKSFYNSELKKYADLVKPYYCSSVYSHTIETSFESLRDWSIFHTIEEVREWFLNKRENTTMSLKEVGVNDLDDWIVDPTTGNISHSSKDFFIVRGLKIKVNGREASKGWDQPILEQVGYDGGILGIIRKRFDGIPHYLCEAKTEPGNYGHVQISPTIQATFANLNQSHEGRKPYFSKYFYGKDKFDEFTILFDAWLAEDGGRLYNKRNKGILLEVPEDHAIDLPTDNFIWLSLHQIKELMIEDAWVNPHVRGILFHA